MNQQVNLYLPEFRKGSDSLSALNGVKALGALLVLLVLVTGMQYWGTAQLNAELSLKQQERADAIARTNALIASFGVQTKDEALIAQVMELQEGLAEKRALLRFLEGRDLGNTAGFSEYLADLSRYHVNGLRITGVELQNGGESVTLSGEVLKAEYVPMFLQNLSQGKSYAGRNFETLHIETSTDNETAELDVMSFDVATTGVSGN